MTDTMTIRNDVTVKLIQHMGDDRAVIAAARVSTKGIDSEAAFFGTEGVTAEASGLINFLMRNRHGTPFEHNAMTFLIEAPIMVFREFHRHRIGWSYNEESARYKQLDPTFYIPAGDRALVQEGKPGHYIYVPGTFEQHQRVIAELVKSYRTAYTAYVQMLELGIAKEVARACLPVAIFSSMYATCNTRSLMAFLSLRTKREAWDNYADIEGGDDLNELNAGRAKFPSFPMREIEMVAEGMEAEFKRLFPLTFAAYETSGRVCP